MSPFAQQMVQLQRMAVWNHRSKNMDASLWSNLPEDLVDRVLACLSLPTFYRFRTVCKRWNSLITSPSFLQCWSEMATECPWLLMIKRRDNRLCPAYDSLLSKWHAVSLNFLPLQATEVVATCEGLLCLRAEVSGSLFVCNPLTKRWRELPTMLMKNQARGIVGMTVNKATKCYKIIVAGSNSDLYDRKTEVYDSATDSWKRSGDLPARTDLRPEYAVCLGSMYFTTSEPFSLLAFNIAEDVWRKVEVPMPCSLTCSRLLVNNGILVLVGGVGKNGISRSFCIWKLEKETMEWQECERMPDYLCRKFLAMCYHNYEHISCIGHMDLICLASFSWPETLVYDASLKSWHWLPRCPLTPLQSGGFSWLSFQPRLDAAV
ncbi:hypothetical protein MPTK1_4g06840 [Marchantia polymorpha subsp. ruderalis]|nr:hypothetical protein MARPO_0125s0029 [Marchantia polymorpha]BBN07860.1 hypothetical protein Mp_4g06840 [Marchantia polymorpha subsp. ruderalis]|eukprot:PTQ30394.1 hypothetical protein MARPO_0125s0029 [Marchantia polymorpha]